MFVVYCPISMNYDGHLGKYDAGEPPQKMQISIRVWTSNVAASICKFI